MSQKLRRDQVRIRYKPRENTYHYFVGDHESDPIPRTTIDHPQMNDEAKDVFFWEVAGGPSPPEFTQSREDLMRLDKKALITICVQHDIDWTYADTAGHLVDRIASHFGMLDIQVDPQIEDLLDPADN